LSSHFESIDQVVDELADSNYIADRALATVLFLAHRLEKPIFFEGEPGVGKTEVGIVLSRLFDTELIRLQCYEGLDSSTALYEWNYPKQLLHIRLEEQGKQERNKIEEIIYSPVSMVEKKDLGRFDRGDVQVAQLALKKMMEPFKIDISRRSKRGLKSGNIDFPRVIKKSLKTGGIPFELFYRQKKKRLKRLVILADVSGSMDRYARFVMPFLLGLRGVGSRAEVFVFSTSLTPITFMVRHLDVEKALERIVSEVPDRSGGTRIGYSLHQFNQGHGERLLSRRTVVVLLSDGWDLGGKDLLRREMACLSNRAYSVIWLNPLAGDPDYEPLCRGMKSALPYIDYFLPADSLESLKRVGRLLSRIMIH